MTKEVKDTIEVMAANGGALGLTLIQCNEILQFISLSLAIAFTIYKFIKKKK
jgi:EamA domain-containing membrane protein RarD|tara:strand:+ start:632 stop:787 length:156 start_codon:yes stop_codon:yes gene_type:complete